MSLDLLISPPASGKTQACLDALQALFKHNPTANAWVIVTDRLQADQFRARLARMGGAINVRVETFRNLYLEMLERSGCPMPPLTSPALQHSMVQAAVARTPLDYFAPLAGMPGFTGLMQSTIAEAERGLVSPEDILAQADPERPGHKELARIYRAYLDLQAAAGWMSPEGLASRAVQALKDCPHLLADIDLLVVDGFDWFETAQFETLSALSTIVRRILVTLPGDPDRERAVNGKFQKSAEKLSALPGCSRLSPCKSTYLPPALSALDSRLMDSPALAYKGEAAAVSLLEARSPSEESREALRWIKGRIVRGRVHPARCAVLVPDPERYFPLLRQAAAEFGLPVRFTWERRLVDTPLVSAVLNLLNLAPARFPRRSLLEVLGSPFFDFAPFGLDRRQVDVLDLVSRHGKVIEGISQWQEVFAALQRPLDGEITKPADEEDGERTPELPRGERARALWDALRTALDALSPREPVLALHAWAAWLEDILASLCFYEAASRQDPKAAASLSGLRDALQGLLAAESVLPRGPLDHAGFAAALQSSLEGLGYMRDSAPVETSIRILPHLEARGARFDSVALLGLAEGVFPRVERPDPLLDEAVRARLGLRARLEQDQLSDFYQAVTRADSALLLTRPYLADTGDPWEASPYWNAVNEIFPGRVVRVRPEAARALHDAASPQEALFWAARQGMTASDALPPNFESLSEHSARVEIAGQRLRQKLGSSGQDPAGAALQALVQSRLGAGETWSASRLEMYLSCPNRFFIESFLGLEAHEPPDWDYDPAQLGSLLHAVLEQVYACAQDPTDLESVLAELPRAAAEAFDAAPARFGFRPSPLWEQQQAELLERLRDTILGLHEFEDGWRPAYFEQPFGLNGTPPLYLRLDGHKVALHGFIDRIDVRISNPGELRVIDYKSGSCHQAARDLVEGRRLQLAVYALAARDALALGEPVDGFYWPIKADSKPSVSLAKFKHEALRGPEGACAIAADHIQHALDGITDADFRSQPLGGKCPSYCGASAWCWHYQPEERF